MKILKVKSLDLSAFLFLIILVLLGLTKVAQADFINGDFESTYTTTGTATDDPITGWTSQSYIFSGNKNELTPTSISGINIDYGLGKAHLDIYNAADIHNSPKLFLDYSPYDYFLFGSNPASSGLSSNKKTL